MQPSCLTTGTIEDVINKAIMCRLAYEQNKQKGHLYLTMSLAYLIRAWLNLLTTSINRGSDAGVVALKGGRPQ